MRARLTWKALVPAALLFGLACQEGTPVAPQGAILRLSVYPTRIAKTGQADLTVTALRSNGNPVNPGTEIRLSSNLGQIDPVITTDDAGIAHGRLRGDGRVGTATVTAFSGALEPVTIDVAVGQLASSMSLQPTPSAVAETGGEIDILALVRDDQGQPLADSPVNFSTEVGTLASGGKFILTNSGGEAHDHLTVTAADLQSVGDNGFDITAEVGGTGGSVISRSSTIGIQRPPKASFTFTRSGLTVIFTDTSTGSPTSWLWDFGDGTPKSSQRNPVHTFAAADTYVVTLTVRNSIGSDTASNPVQITQ
jgi:hypothetical protein